LIRGRSGNAADWVRGDWVCELPEIAAKDFYSHFAIVAATFVIGDEAQTSVDSPLAHLIHHWPELCEERNRASAQSSVGPAPTASSHAGSVNMASFVL